MEELNPLGAIGLGLMSAGGSLSPQVYGENSNFYSQLRAQDEKKKQFMAELLTQHYQQGTLAPQSYQAAMEKLGMPVPELQTPPDYESLKSGYGEDQGLGGGGGLSTPPAQAQAPGAPAAASPITPPVAPAATAEADPLAGVMSEQDLTAEIRRYSGAVHKAGGTEQAQAKAIHGYYTELKTKRESQLKEANIRSEIATRGRDKSSSEWVTEVNQDDEVVLLNKRTNEVKKTGIKARPPQASETANVKDIKAEAKAKGLKEGTPEFDKFVYQGLHAINARKEAPSQIMINQAPLPKGEVESAAAQHAAGQPLTQVVPGYGSSVAGKREQVRKAAIDQIKKDNPSMTDAEAGRKLAQASIDFVASKSSTMQLQKMYGATVQAVSQLEFNIKKTTEVLKKIPSSDLSPLINGIIRGEEKWTGDPKYSQLYYFMSATAMESARILQGGQASVAQLHAGAAEEARKWANSNMTPKSFIEGVAPAMLEEGKARLSTYRGAIKSQSIGFGDANKDVKVDEESGALTKPTKPAAPDNIQKLLDKYK